MEVFSPAYYHAFQCLAGSCPDSCCKEWTVDVDAEAANFYRTLEGPLGDRLRQVLKDVDGATVMANENARCPMWRQDGLCQIQATLGHAALCKTCRDFPRLCHDYGDFMELGLELSCPEAARLILSGSHKLSVSQIPGGTRADYDTELMGILLSGRKTVLDFLENTALPLPQAFAAILLYAHSLQGQIDGAAPVEPDFSRCLEDGRNFAGHGDLGALLDFCLELDILTDRWRQRLRAPSPASAWSEDFRKLYFYFIGRYWLQAVSDYDLVGRVKFITAAEIIIHALGGDPVSTAQLFSKEIENDPDNLDAILDGCYRSPALTDANLLGLLLNKKPPVGGIYK